MWNTFTKNQTTTLNPSNALNRWKKRTDAYGYQNYGSNQLGHRRLKIIDLMIEVISLTFHVVEDGDYLQQGNI